MAMTFHGAVLCIDNTGDFDDCVGDLVVIKDKLMSLVYVPV